MTARGAQPKSWAPEIIGAVAGAVHVLMCIVVDRTPSEGSWGWFPVFVMDLPVSLVPLLLAPKELAPLWGFGVIGTAWWFFLGRLIAKAAVRPPGTKMQEAGDV